MFRTNWRTLAMIGSLAAITGLTASCTHAAEMMNSALPAAPAAATTDDIPGPMREYRAAWVATVSNIDWPSRPGLSTENQKAEAIKLLNDSRDLGLNCLILQVRPQADAFYASDIEPWSYFLTGQQGKAPDPYYDPLTFWVEEAHKRGLSLHVWFNPYRAHVPATKGDLASNSVIKANPEMVHELANGMWWMDPSREDVQKRSLAVMLDVVKRYDIDGVHMDDYFYPYSSYNDEKDFPDDKEWEVYVTSGGKLSRGDWRRKAVDDFVEDLYHGIKATKPHVLFGLSPFGIWRPDNPRWIRGLDQYDSLYADAKLWLNEGWVDYYTPQLYWGIAQVPQSFPVLLNWWKEQNLKNRNLWPGLGTHKVSGGSYPPSEIVGEVMVARGIVPEGPGHTHFSIKQLFTEKALAEGGVADLLKKGPYAVPALTPTSPWLDNQPPAAPTVALDRTGDAMQVTWNPQGAEESFLFVVYSKTNGNWSYNIVPRDTRSASVPADATEVAVSGVDRLGNESIRTHLVIDAK